ncbi:MAG: LD-carboxypeptidase [Bacteroidota bacterium]
MQSRGEFVKSLAALTVFSLMPFSAAIAKQRTDRQSEPNPRIFPKRLKRGDLIGLVTPGSPITEEQLAETVSKLEGLGFRTTYNDSVLSEYGYFAGKDRERADELMEMFTREDVDGIWCVRGGYGSIRILDLLDFDLIRQNPKVFIGYSDITALIASIYEQTGLVTFHGPVGISDFNRFSLKSLEKVLMDPGATFKYPYNREKRTRDNPEYDRYTLTGGMAEGELIGGNISVLDSMIGSRFEPDFEGKIVYLEEIEEKTYRVDKMVFHMLSGTNLKKAAGIVMGVMGDCNINDEPRLTLKRALDDLLKPLGIPVSYGFPFGHIKRMITIPTGIQASFDADKNSLKLLEPAVL